jgi:WD40 repeat protein/serine/threonine protein kinase
MHFDRSKLKDFATGKLTGHEAQAIEAHLLTCEQCGKTLDEIDLSDDALIGFLRTGASTVHSGEADASLTQTSTSATPVVDQDEGIPQSFGRYRIEQLLGQGGMGVVYRAYDPTLKRDVALKIIAPHRLAYGENRSRFRREAEAAAHLQHANIVQIFEFGEEGSAMYCAFELVDGESLDNRLKTSGISARDAAKVVAILADAVEYAHHRKVVHRDLKPANILFTVDGTPKIADFGLAKRLDDEVSQTSDGTLLGSPCYMAPEQASGSTAAIGPSVDVYALGTLLYESLVGQPPFMQPDLWATLEQVKHADPLPPSRLRPGVDEDLESICLKCLEKDPGDRYPNAMELATDLRRFLDGLPTVARKTTWWQRTVKLTKRHPLPAFLVAAISVVSIAFVAFVLVSNFRLQFALDDAQRMTQLADANAAKEQRANKQLRASLDRQQRISYALQLKRAASVAETNPSRALRILEEECPLTLRDFSWQYLAKAYQPEIGRWHTAGEVSALAVALGGSVFVTGDDRGHIRVWSIDHDEPLQVIDKAHQAAVTDIAFSRDGEWLATASEDGTAKVWLWREREAKVELTSDATRVNGVAFSPDGQKLATAHARAETPSSGVGATTRGGLVRVWRLPSGELEQTLSGHAASVFRVSFNSDGTRLASGSPDGRLRLWDVSDWSYTEHPAFGTDLVFHPLAADTLAMASMYHDIRVCRVADGPQLQQQTVTRRFPRRISTVAFSPDGSRLVAASYDGTTRIRSLDSTEVVSLEQPGQLVTAAAFTDNERLLTGTDQGQLRYWDLGDRMRSMEIMAHPTRAVNGVVFRSDGKAVLTSGLDGAVRLWSTADGSQHYEWSVEGQSISGAGLASNNELVAWESGGVGYVADFAADRDFQPAGVAADALLSSSLALSHTGRLLAVVDFGGLRLIDVANGRMLPHALEEEVTCLAASAATEEFAAAGTSGRVWLVRAEGPVEMLAEFDSPVLCLAISRDGQAVAAGLASTGGAVVNSVSGETVMLTGYSAPINCLDFSPDGKTVATGDDDGDVRLWDAAIGAERLVLKTSQRVLAIAFDNNATRLAAGGDDGILRLWKTVD